MATWKVLFIVVLALACLTLGSATVIVPMGKSGGQAWMWFAALFSATVVAGGLFALFLRYAGNELLVKRRW
ncbi:hypothetical protein [Limnoglobus roseus]|uniref:Uncharacterized protein n=1 Tax=Limnoglobus roseus TaxID=2598579 RepID=A0A5C1AMQ3_9BACT|nr:hypothetical protein [Limnoglobus roseus]QEL20521.1 hypothetical protein PX52LOC_07626 [Limnoglobus roseus]